MNKMPEFLKKKKRDPKSTAPAKNTKGFAKNKKKGLSEVNKDNDRAGNQVPVVSVANKADAWLDRQSRPKNRGH